jgi:hypothetical protein
MSTSAQPIPKKDKRLLIYVVALFLLTVFSRIILISFHNANFGGLDMNVIYGIQRILLGEPLYQDPGLPSYAIIQYSPLFYYTAAATGRLFGVGGHDVQGVYMVARSLSLLFNLLTVLMAAGIIRMWALPWWKVWTYALPILMVVTLEYYTRGDSMHLVFFVGAMYTALLYLRKQSLGALFFSAVLAGCCIMSKQSGVLSLGIIGFYLLFIERRFFLAILFGILSLLSAAVVAWLLSRGDWLPFYQNAYLGLKNGLDWTWVYTIFTSQFYYDLIPFYFLGGIMTYYAVKEKVDQQYRFLATGAALSFLFALITGLKIGSGNNYFTELIFFVLCALPYLLQSDFGHHRLLRFGKRSLSVRSFAYIAFFIIISSKTMGLVSSIYIERWVRDKKDLYVSQQALLKYFKDTLALQKGEYIHFSKRDFLDNIFIGYSLMPTEDVIGQVYRSNPTTFDYSKYIQGMNTGMIKYIVTDTADKAFPAKEEEIPFIQFHEQAFQKLADVEGYTIYQYKGGS